MILISFLFLGVGMQSQAMNTFKNKKTSSVDRSTPEKQLTSVKSGKSCKPCDEDKILDREKRIMQDSDCTDLLSVLPVPEEVDSIFENKSLIGDHEPAGKIELNVKLKKKVKSPSEQEMAVNQSLFSAPQHHRYQCLFDSPIGQILLKNKR